MAYLDPRMVLSPRGRVKNLELKHDTGEGGWSLVKMLWDGEERFGIRWNGNADDNPNGTPQTRGIPTWFVLPDDLNEFFEDWLVKK